MLPLELDGPAIGNTMYYAAPGAAGAWVNSRMPRRWIMSLAVSLLGTWIVLGGGLTVALHHHGDEDHDHDHGQTHHADCVLCIITAGSVELPAPPVLLLAWANDDFAGRLISPIEAPVLPAPHLLSAAPRGPPSA